MGATFVQYVKLIIYVASNFTPRAKVSYGPCPWRRYGLTVILYESYASEPGVNPKPGVEPESEAEP